MSIYIEHANITVKSIAESLKLLQAALPEFRVRGEGDGSERKWLHFGDDKTYITLNEALDSSGKVSRKDYSRSGVNHLAFVVDDIDGVDQRLKAEGFESDPQFQEDSDIRRRYYYEDANGLEWEFVQYLTDDLEARNQY